MLKKLTVNFLLLFITFIFCFGALEIFIRLFYPQDILWKVEDKVLGYKYQPNLSGQYSRKNEFKTFIKINSLGFRDDDHRIEKPAGVCRLVFIGDSFIAGFEVNFEKHFSKLLGHNLNQAPIGDCQQFEVLNFGVAGWGTDQEFLAFKNIALEFKPDIVILGFSVINDVRNNSLKLDKLYQQKNKTPNPKNYFILENEKLVRTNTLAEENFFGQPKIKLKRFLKNNFQSIAFIAKRIRKIKFLAKPLVKIGIVSDMFVELSKDYIPLDYQIYSQNYNKDWQNAWAVTKKLILEFDKLAKQNSADFILLIIPNREQIYQDLWGEILENYPAMKASELVKDKPQLELMEFCKQEKLNCLNLLPIFKTHAKENPKPKLYFKYDGHFTETGHEKLNQVLYEYLKDLKTSTSTDKLFDKKQPGN
jgi:hypothetical protein